MKSILKNERGVALMMVLGAILILSTLVVEFAYNSHVGYELASSERDRLKAYYLARSGYNLARLELKFEKDIKTRFANMMKNLKGSGVTSDPLCKQIPLSTGLLKGISSGTLPGMGGSEAAEGEEGSEAETNEEPKAPEQPTGEAVAGAEEFLNFDGDFAVECDTEERKLSLSVFRADPLGTTTGGATPPPAGGSTLSAYDMQKELLFSLLSQKEFETALGDKADKPDEIRKIVNAIADWADKDDRINEAPGIGGGSEDADYADLGYKVKNGKYATVAELLLVSGVGDDLFEVLAPQVTVYGGNKINICQAEDPMIRAFITRYMAATGMQPISPTDDEKWNQLIETIRLACEEPNPQPAPIAAAIAPLIGATNTKTFADQITTTNRFYRIEATGLAGESQAKIAAVIDANQANPNLWKTLYFRVE